MGNAWPPHWLETSHKRCDISFSRYLATHAAYVSNALQGGHSKPECEVPEPAIRRTRRGTLSVSCQMSLAPTDTTSLVGFASQELGIQASLWMDDIGFHQMPRTGI
jgi:hypothetical protein